jgi:Fur family peroxide stress response transcriptional regulator
MSEAPAERLAGFEAECRRRGLAVTVQRRAVYGVVSSRRDHPTADQVYEAVKGRVPGLSRTTVYRVLDTLVDTGFVRRVHHAGGVTRFDPTTERHHHLVCEACGRLVDLEDAAVPALRLPEARGTGFRISDYSVSFLGLCGSCARSKRSEPRPAREGRTPKN